MKKRMVFAMITMKTGYSPSYKTKRSPVARSLRSPRSQMIVVKSKKGKGSYDRKKKINV